MRRIFLPWANVALTGAMGLWAAVAAHGQAPTGGYALPPSMGVASQAPYYDPAGPQGSYAPAVMAPAAACMPSSGAQPYAAASWYPPAPVPGPPQDGCAPAIACPPPAIWSVHAGGLLLFQDNENHDTFSYDSLVETNQLLDFKELEPDLLPGVEIGVTRFDCCEMTGWEGLYWGLFPEDSTAHAYNTDVTGDLNPILNFDQLDYDGSSANNYTNDAVVHRLRRSSEFHNAELNRLWGLPMAGCSPWQVRTLAGFRFFRFEEGLEFAADADDAMLTGEADELYYTIDAENNLYGLQLGGSVERRTSGRLTLTAGAKAGVFGNDASAHSRIGGSAGTATVNNGPNNGRVWDLTAEKQDVAFLGEVQAGLTYQIGARWKAIGQYRVLSASGVALPANQIYPDLRGVQDAELLNTNGSLLLHGVFVGAERVF